MSTVPVSQDRLDSWARFADRVRHKGLTAGTKIARRELSELNMELKLLSCEAADVMVDLRHAGAAPPDGQVLTETPLEILSTPTSRRFVALLSECLDQARRLDHERGFTEEGNGPYSDTIARLLAEIEPEAFPPSGRGE